MKLDTNNIDDISYEVICWRKSNHIHKWFVENVQEGNDNCDDYCVTKQKLLEFKKVLEQVNEIAEQIKLYNSKEPGRGYREISAGHREELSNILPTESGFFFGSDQYADWYFDDVSYTLEELNKELLYLESNKELSIRYEYSSSW